METDPESIIDGYHRACKELGGFLTLADDSDLRRRSSGTRWTNEELPSHMVFGYMVVLALLPLVKFFGHLPPLFGKLFARLLNAGTGPFNLVNYWGSRAASLVYNRHRMLKKLQRVTAALERGLTRESQSHCP